jgi:hypothetical protein
MLPQRRRLTERAISDDDSGSRPGKGGRLPADQADFNYNVAANHGDFAGMMTASGPQGVSAERMLLDGGWPRLKGAKGIGALYRPIG